MFIEGKYVLLFGEAVGNWSSESEDATHNRAFVIVGDNPELDPTAELYEDIDGSYVLVDSSYKRHNDPNEPFTEYVGLSFDHGDELIAQAVNQPDQPWYVNGVRIKERDSDQLVFGFSPDRQAVHVGFIPTPREPVLA
jgi:hypothetical protein